MLSVMRPMNLIFFNVALRIRVDNYLLQNLTKQAAHIVKYNINITSKYNTKY